MRIRNRIFLWLAAIGAGITPGSGQLLSQPIVGHTTDTGASIWAYAGSGKNVELEYGPVGTPNSALIRISAPPRSDRNFTSLARLPGLKAATPYRYRILVDGVMAKEAQFTTAPQADKPHAFSYFLASCMQPEFVDNQQAWSAVAGQKADFNLFIGDNVYANSTNYETLWNAHMSQRRIATFASLIRTAPTWATWDDHDYGPNDSHGATPGKENSLRAFKDLWPNPSYGLPQTPGVFFSYHWANVHFIVMDTRYHRTDESAPYTPEKTQYGTAQLEWLFQQLKASRSPFKVIVSSYNIMSGYFPNDIRKIAEFIKVNKIYGVTVQSGDIHFNQITKKDVGMGYPLLQITSSGVSKHLNRTWAMIDVNTTLADPTLSARFFTREKIDSTMVFKLSSLTPPDAKDLILTNPVGGEQLPARARAAIEWTRIGTGIDQVNIEYSLGSQWISIAKGAPNTGTYSWSVPDINSQTVKVRVSDVHTQAITESPRVFGITAPLGKMIERDGGREALILTRVPGSRAFRLKVSPGVESVRVYDLEGTMLADLPVLDGIALWTAPGSAGDGKAPGLHVFQPMSADGSRAGASLKFIF